MNKNLPLIIVRYLDMITLMHITENNTLPQIRTKYVIRLDAYSLTIVYSLTIKIDSKLLHDNNLLFDNKIHKA